MDTSKPFDEIENMIKKIEKGNFNQITKTILIFIVSVITLIIFILGIILKIMEFENFKVLQNF